MIITKLLCLLCIIYAVYAWITETTDQRIIRHRKMYGTSYKALSARFGLSTYKVRKICLA